MHAPPTSLLWEELLNLGVDLLALEEQVLEVLSYKLIKYVFTTNGSKSDIGDLN